MQEKHKFYIGIDIGTDSVGVACTDENYRLLRARGKDLWAVRLFDEAKSAAERRIKRTARRRLQRRKQRIDWLQEIFAPHLEDDSFFIRLNNSGFEQSDKDELLQSRFSLFADEQFTDIDFYNKFPTIFHLRHALAEKTEKAEKTDLRLYYLALHHIVKYRGHFLFEGESISEILDIEKLFDTFNNAAQEIFPEDNIRLPPDKAKEFRKIAKSEIGYKKKKELIEQLFEADKITKDLIGMLLGGKIKASVLFGEEYKEESICFKELSDDELGGMSEIFGDFFSVIEAARAIYNYILLEKVLDGHKNISSAMVALYEKHRDDLKLLKHFVRTELSQNAYYDIFRSDKEKANYANYVCHTKRKGNKISLKRCSYDNFGKFLKKVLTEREADIKDRKTLDKILSEIENRSFLPKILNADNGLFPRQVNGGELDAILKNLCREYPAFAQKDETGFSLSDKIRKLFVFRIPYFVGPLNNSHEENSNSWVVRKQGKITPWNYDDMVDEAASNEKFIRRMTNKCTYVYGKDVLPKCSMYYQAFNVLNQLNKLRLNEQPISVELKQELFTKLFLIKRQVSDKTVKNYLVSIGQITKSEAAQLDISGFDFDLKANMGSYITLKNCLGDFVDKNPDVCENIILWHTLNTDKNMVEKLILNHYGDIPVIREKIKALKGIASFKKFGRLSKFLLCELSCAADETTRQNYTVLNRLYHTNDNFNQLLYSDEYRFNDAIEEINGNRSEVVGLDDVNELYVSPMVRRGIWQALTMTDEYIQAVGRNPDKIFIEVTRSHDENKTKTQSRKDTLLKIYKELAKTSNEISNLLNELNDKTVSQLRQERLYLYFLQLGRCAYTGKRIGLDELNGEIYDVDHILPRSIIKDDSVENKVLVLRSKNKDKGDTYPLPADFTDQHDFWKLLKDKDLMGAKKYALLTRTEPLNDADFNDFINRQLVVTNQTAKAAAELMKRKYGGCGTCIVYSKAKNVDEFKQQYGIVKCRETNDLHHARDAYLNVVVGNVYDTKFTKARDYFYRKNYDWREYNLKKLFEHEIDGAWSGLKAVSDVKQILKKPSMQVTRYAFTNKGSFYNEMAEKKEEENIDAPRKEVAPYTQTDKYGGYKSLTVAYFAVVQSTNKKGNLIKTIEAIPVLENYKRGGEENKVLEYLSSQGLNQPRLLVPKIKIKTLVSINGFKAYIAAKSNKQIILHNAQQWFTDSDTDLYVKNLVKLLDWVRMKKLSDSEENNDKFVMVANRKGEVLVVNRENNISLFTTILKKLQSKLYQRLACVRSYTLKLEQNTEAFSDLSVLNQAKVLMEIVGFMKCNAAYSDLSLLNEGKSCGELRIGKNITDVDFAIIHQSPCGLTTRTRKV